MALCHTYTPGGVRLGKLVSQYDNDTDWQRKFCQVRRLNKLGEHLYQCSQENEEDEHKAES